MTAQGEHHLLHIGRAVGTSQKTDERPWRSQPEAAWSRWVVPASCVSNVIRAVLAPVLVLDFAPTRRRSRQSQRGEGTLFPRVCFALAQSTSVFILAFPFATSLFSLPIAPVRRFITPLRCGLILRTLYPSFCFLALLPAALASSDTPLTPSGCQLLPVLSNNCILASFLIRLFDPRA